MKRAIEVMEANNALEKYHGNSPWTAPTFGITKKNNKVQIVTDFRKLNEAVILNPWPMPTIQDMLHQCGGMVYATNLDMIMSYYAMNVRKDMWRYLVIIIPWGKYVYKKMPMVLKISADVFQKDLVYCFKTCHTF